MAKSKKNNKIFNKTEKIITKNLEIVKISSNLSDIKLSINEKFNDLSIIELEAITIKNKIESTPKSVRMEAVIDDLPATTLRELEGDFSKKLRYKDLGDLYKMNKKASKIIEEQEILFSKQKILNIELLQKKIEILLNG